jgi:hypothetical protein
MKLENGTFIVHLPPSMARVLNDSLPGFELVQRSAYDTAIVRWMDGWKQSDGPAPLSVAIGDFDGDSKADIAMKGIARDSAATVFVLGRSATRPEPRLIFVGRPQLADRATPEWVFLVLVRPGPITEFDEGQGSQVLQLRTEAVEVVYFEKASEVYYLIGGELRSVATSD